MPSTAVQRQKFSGCKTTNVPSGYVGEVQENLREGYGVYTYPNSFFRFEGEWSEGLKHGFGKLKMRDGSYYEGEFVNGEIYGTGTRFWSHNGNCYEGEFENGEMNGKGVMKFGNGDVYEGMWMDNKMEGEGFYRSKSGTTYKGSFHLHKKHGEGTLTSDDESYCGGWINNMKHGNGFYQFPDDSTYQGQWKADLMNGEGTLIHSSGIIYTGLWTNGRPLLECVKMVQEGEQTILLEQNDVVFSININCLTDDDEITTESGRLLKVSAGIRYQEKPITGIPGKTTIDEIPEETSENNNRRSTPFGFDIEPYPICIKLEEQSTHPSPSASPITQTYNEETGNENATPTIDVNIERSETTESPKEEDMSVESNETIPPHRTENGRITFANLTLPAIPQVHQTNSGIASLSPENTDARKFNRGRRSTEVATTKLGDLRNTRLKGDLEKLAEEGREGSGGSTRRRRNRPNKQEEKMEELFHENHCRPGDYVIIVEDMTENAFLDVVLDPVFIHVVVQPVVRKTRSKTDKK